MCTYLIYRDVAFAATINKPLTLYENIKGNVVCCHLLKCQQMMCKKSCVKK